MNIYQRIKAVMEDIQYLAKDDRVEFGSTKYKAISEEKVTSIVRVAMIKNGLVMYPETQEIIREQQITPDGKVLPQITTVNVTYRMVNIDNPDEQIQIASSGQGSDTQDKGSGKAMTYAFKYALLRTFMIPTGEDPDKISSAELDARQELETPVVNRSVLNSRILALGGGDLERVNTFICRLFKTDNLELDTITDDQAQKTMTALAKAVRK